MLILQLFLTILLTMYNSVISCWQSKRCVPVVTRGAVRGKHITVFVPFGHDELIGRVLPCRAPLRSPFSERFFFLKLVQYVNKELKILIIKSGNLQIYEFLVCADMLLPF